MPHDLTTDSDWDYESTDNECTSSQETAYMGMFTPMCNDTTYDSDTLLTLQVEAEQMRGEARQMMDEFRVSLKILVNSKLICLPV